MRRVATSLAVSLLLTSGPSGIIAAGSNFDRNNTDANSQAACTLVGIPFLDPEKTRPVAVTAVTSSQGRVASVFLLNQLAPVRSLKLRWYFVNKDDPGRILQQGETPELNVSLSGKDQGRQIEYPPIYVSDSSEDTNLKTHLIIGIGEVIFADGGIWRESEKVTLQEDLMIWRKAAEDVLICEFKTCQHTGLPPPNQTTCVSTEVALNCTRHFNGSCSVQVCP